MPVTLLHRIARANLPLAVASSSEVDMVRVLVLGGHLKATIPQTICTPDGIHQPPATVTAITSLGRLMLQSFPLNKRSSGARRPVS